MGDAVGSTKYFCFGRRTLLTRQAAVGPAGRARRSPARALTTPLSALASASPPAGPSTPPAASHEAHLNRMVHLGAVPPMLARIVAAVDQVGPARLQGPACLQ